MAESFILKETVPPITAELVGLIEGQSMFHARIVRELEAMVLTGTIDEVRAQFCSLEMWGGSGSVADLSLGGPNVQKQACELLSRLNSEFHKAGIECPRADQWTGTFDKWLDEGVFDKHQ